MNKYIKTTLLLFIIIFSCSEDNSNNLEQNVCLNSQQEIENLFTDLINNQNFETKTTMDLEYHSYKFSSNSNGQICSIGYQGISDGNIYEIQIIDSNANLIFSDNLTFSINNQEYVEIIPIEINNGEIYTIKRKITNVVNNDDLLGKIVVSDPFNNTTSFPIILGTLTIHNSLFYDIDETYAVDLGSGVWIPYITFGFNSN